MDTKIIQDTTVIKQFDSLIQIEGKQQHFILIQDQKTKQQKAFYEESWMTSLVFPILVSIAIAWYASWRNRKRNEIEMEKTAKETEKLETEITKMKKDFQPVAVGVLQAVQEKVIADKIEGLRVFLKVYDEIFRFEQKFYEGEPIISDADEYYDLVFKRVSSNTFNMMDDFILRYANFYGNETKKILSDTSNLLYEVYDRNKRALSMNDEYYITDGDIALIKKLSKSIDKSIEEIRSDCFLDNDFVHRFVKEQGK